MTAAGYGDVTAEYLAARRGAAVLETNRDLVWVRGPDSVTFLDGMLSRAVEQMALGQVAPSLLLSPRGKLRAVLWVLRGEDEVGLLADEGLGDRVAADLTRFKIRVDVTIDVEPRHLLEVWGPSASHVVGVAGLPVPDSAVWLSSPDALTARLPFTHVALDRLLVAGASVDDLVAGGGHRGGRQAATAIRVEAGEPVMDVDINEATIPQEAGIVLATVDFEKGCYLGQELVSRIDARGKVNRHLRGLVVSDTVIPPVGAGVFADETELGTVTSVAESLSLAAPVALALVRREAQPGDIVELRWDGGAATAEVRSLPLDNFEDA